jgi:hypothetical protein
MRVRRSTRLIVHGALLGATLASCAFLACSGGGSTNQLTEGADAATPETDAGDASKGVVLDAKSVLKDVTVKDVVEVDVVRKDVNVHDVAAIDVEVKDVSIKDGQHPLKDAVAVEDATYPDVVTKDVQVEDVVTVDDADTTDGGCQALQAPCVGADNCCTPGALCAYVGGLNQTWCCMSAGGDCASDNDCCGELGCVNGTCSSTTCVPLEQPCATAADCCAPGALCASVGGLTQLWCCADQGQACSTPDDCCGSNTCAPDGTCQPNTPTCADLQSPCATATDCCTSGAECAPVGGLGQNWCCAGYGSACASDNDCCGDYTCGASGTCEAASCYPLESPCTTAGDCCDPGARCTTIGAGTEPLCCAGQGSACSIDSDCCGQYSCTGGVCAATACLLLQEPCVDATDCCDPGVACDSVGGLTQTWCCAPQGVTCGTDNDCCGSFACVGGVCQ